MQPNSAFLQAGLLTATACLFAYCLTLHKVAWFRSITAYALTLSTFVSFVCVRWIPGAVYDMVALTFFLLALSGGTVAYANYLAPETDRIRTGAKLAYGIGAFLLFVLILWTLDNYSSQQVAKTVTHVSGQVDKLAMGQQAAKRRADQLDAKTDTLARNDTALANAVQQTKVEILEKVDQAGTENSERLINMSLQQQRMNTNLQKQRRR